jgi:cell division protein YceG involved in septum cleavage
MSENDNYNNVFIIGGLAALSAGVIGFFAMSNYNSYNNDVVKDEPNNIEVTEDTTPVNLIKDESADEIIEAAKKATVEVRANNPNEIVVIGGEETNEAAIHTQVNEAVKNAENEE